MKKFLSCVFLNSLIAAVALPAFAADPVAVSVTVDPSKPGFKIPDDYAGLSYETQRTEPDANYTGSYYFRPDNTALINMFKTLGLKNLRIGGNTVDNLKVPIPTTADIDHLFGFAKAAGVKVIYSFRLRNGGDVQGTAAQAKYIADHYAANLLCFSMGNEPDLFLGNWNSYKKAWMPLYDAINAVVPNAKYLGPSLTSNHLPYAHDFARELWPSGKIVYITQHQYAGGAGNDQKVPEKGIDLLLSKDWPDRNYQTYYDKFVPGLNGAPWRLEEANNFYNGGAKDISNTFAAALWGMDYLYWYGSHGSQGVNFHNGDNVAAGQGSAVCNYASFTTSPEGYTAHPLAYGIKMFNLGSKGSFVPITVQSGINVVGYAVLGNDKNLYITLINKEHIFHGGNNPDMTVVAAAADVTLDVGPGYTSGKFIALIAPSVDAKTGVTIGGNPIKDDGSFVETWSPLPAAPAGGKVSIKLPATSAMVVKLTP